METGITHSGGEYHVALDGVLLGIRSTYGAALALLSDTRAARLEHPTATTPAPSYAEIVRIREAGLLGEFVKDLDDDGLSAVAHVLVTANHANGRVIEYSEVYSRLDALRTLESTAGIDAATPAPSAPPSASRNPNANGYTAGYELGQRRIVIRTRRGDVWAMCDTWLQVDALMSTIGRDGFK